MSTAVSFDVIGDPAPQGSKSRMPNGQLIEGRDSAQRERHHNWRNAVADAARDAMADEGITTPLDGPLSLQITFRFRRPKSWPKKRLNWHTSAPDIDKLVRSVGDSLTAAGLIVDDRLVCHLKARAIVIDTGATGATILVYQITSEPGP